MAEVNGYGQMERRLRQLEDQLVDRSEWDLAAQVAEHLGEPIGQVGEIINDARRLARSFGGDEAAMNRFCAEIIGCPEEEFAQKCREVEAWLDEQGEGGASGG